MNWTKLRPIMWLLGVTIVIGAAMPVHPGWAGTPITIWNLGDSVTDGAGSPKTGETDSGGLRKSMINELIAEGYDPTLYGSVKTEHPDRIPKIMDMPRRVFHEGHNGFTIAGVMGGVESWLEKSPSNGDQPIYPDFITVMIGTNDTGKFYFKGKDTKTPEDEKQVIGSMSKDVHALIEKITTMRPKSHVLVSSIIPSYWAYGIDDKITGHPYPGDGAPKDQTDYLNNHYTRAYNHYLQIELVPEFQKAGKNVSFVDIYPEFIGQDKDGNTVILTKLFGDITHPNTLGYDKIGTTFAKAIAKIAKESASSTAGEAKQQ